MNKIFKMLNDYNDNYLFNVSDNRQLVKKYDELWKDQGLSLKVDNDFDFIDFLIKKQSFDNMEAIKNKFFEVKEELRELWDVVSYPERHFLLYKELNPFIDTLKSFTHNEERIFITYFDKLINAYYDHDMLMFDNINYRKFLYNYTQLVNDNSYGILPLVNGYTTIDVIKGDDTNYVMYKRELKRFYIVNHIAEDEVYKATFALTYNPNERQINDILDLLLSGVNKDIVQYLLDENLVHKKLIRKFNKILVKM